MLCSSSGTLVTTCGSSFAASSCSFSIFQYLHPDILPAKIRNRLFDIIFYTAYDDNCSPERYSVYHLNAAEYDVAVNAELPRYKRYKRLRCAFLQILQLEYFLTGRNPRHFTVFCNQVINLAQYRC